MFARNAVVAAALAATFPAFAGDNPIEQLSRQTGVSERHICMVVHARTAYAEYRPAFNRVERELKKQLGTAGYDRLLKGEVAAAAEIHRARIADMAVAREALAPAEAAGAKQG